MTINNPHIVFAGGGTAGHLFPGLAVAEQLLIIAPRARITIATGSKPQERELVLRAGYEHLQLPSRPLPRGPRGAWRFVKENLAGYRAAARFARAEDISLVVGLGGYASAPMAWAAAAGRLPLVLLEQNTVPGRATRWFAPRASLVCIAFEEAGKLLRAAGPVRLTGNPIRSGFESADHSVVRLIRRPPRKAASVEASSLNGDLVSDGPANGGLPRAARLPQRQLLILGGSGGAHTLNEQIPRALYKLHDQLRGWRIVHQTGSRDREATAALYRKLAVPALTVSFVERLQPLLRGADLVISRAGGTTLAELATTGSPALLVPYPHAASDHQRKNANIFAAAGAAEILDTRELDGRLDNAFASALTPLLQNEHIRQSMSRSMRELARPDAAWHVATMIAQLSDMRTAPQAAIA